MVTAIYSVLHLLVDAICAFAMLGKFVVNPVDYKFFLIYNFCAFALQMPLGALLDMVSVKTQKNLSFLYATSGVICTIAGAICHPAILGIGNALFHVGGGVHVIKEDNLHNWQGQALGIFVAPGALGLFIGTQLANLWSGKSYVVILGLVGIISICLVIVLGIYLRKISNYRMTKANLEDYEEDLYISSFNKSLVLLTACCVFVVILRSFIGMAVIFPWKTTLWLGFISVMAVVLGKMTGGILSAKFGMRKTMMVSLLLASVCYLLSDHVFLGMAALFFFNMTMPITLYLLVCKWEDLPGFSFGLLTFGLFLGFLPIYFGMEIGMWGSVLGAAGSIVSLLLLAFCIPQKD